MQVRKYHYDTYCTPNTLKHIGSRGFLQKLKVMIEMGNVDDREGDDPTECL